MENEFDLKGMREVWQKQATTHQYTQGQIFDMLKRKSLTSVKWIFYISLIEIIIGVLISVYFLYDLGLRNYHIQLQEQYGNGAYLHEASIIIASLVNLYFLFLFFKGYASVNAQSSVKSLTEDIMSFKNTVSKFIYFNLIAVLFILVMTIIMLIFEDKLSFNTEQGWVVLAVLVVFFAFIIGIVYLYYYLLYGTFTRRLKRNLNALSEIDNE
ncbi:MAG: hypothetical protein ACR2MS_01295 [Weeksellaceae bacterium]